MKRCLLILLLCGTVIGQTNTPNPNPLRLDSRGKAQVYFGPGPYRLVLYAPWKQMTGNYCNGSAMGAIEWEIDNVHNPGNDSKVKVSPTTSSEFKKKDGTPAAGYFLCSYKAGTTTPLTTYREPYVKPKPQTQRDDCETYYANARHFSGGGMAVFAAAASARMIDTPKMHAYATMFLACKERNR